MLGVPLPATDVFCSQSQPTESRASGKCQINITLSAGLLSCLSLRGCISGLRIAGEPRLLILSDTARVQRSNGIYKVRTGDGAAESIK